MSDFGLYDKDEVHKKFKLYSDIKKTKEFIKDSHIHKVSIGENFQHSDQKLLYEEFFKYLFNDLDMGGLEIWEYLDVDKELFESTYIVYSGKFFIECENYKKEG